MRKAFTLVELLVVIAIISLLISILAPSLNIAKEIAIQVVCSSNMSSSGKAIHLYCHDNDDKYPPWRSLWKDGKPKAEAMPNAEKTFQIAKVGDLDPRTLAQRWRGAGFFYGANYFETPDCFYCRAQSGSWYVREAYQDPKQLVAWGSYSSITNMVRSGLLWNAWGKWYNDGTVDMLGKNWDFAFRTLSSMENDKPLIIDHAIFPWYVNVHMAQGPGRPTFNVTFNDAHVTAYTVPGTGVYNDILCVYWNEPSGGILTNWANNPGPNNDWADAYYFITQGG